MASSGPDESVMADNPVPEDVREFIKSYIDSVAQLEALLFLRAHVGESWGVSTTAKHLFAPEDEISGALEQLTADGFLKRSDSVYTYDCSMEMRLKVDRLADTYRRFLIPIANLIHAKRRGILFAAC